MCADNGREGRNGSELLQKKTKSSELSFAALWLVPSPRYFANLNGSQDLATCYAGNRCARRLNANHSVFERAEAADTGLIHRDWNGIGLVRHGRISACDTGSREVVTALDASRQHAVDQASRGRRRNARYERSSAQSDQGRSEAHRRISILVGDFTRIDGADGANSRRLIGRHAGAQQVWNRDRCNDQD